MSRFVPLDKAREILSKYLCKYSKYTKYSFVLTDLGIYLLSTFLSFQEMRNYLLVDNILQYIANYCAFEVVFLLWVFHQPLFFFLRFYDVFKLNSLFINVHFDSGILCWHVCRFWENCGAFARLRALVR